MALLLKIQRHRGPWEPQAADGPRTRDLELASLPVWLMVLFGTLAVARVLVWAAPDAEHRRVYRRRGLVVFWLVWVAFWVWVLAEVTSVGELIRDKEAWIAANGRALWQFQYVGKTGVSYEPYRQDQMLFILIAAGWLSLVVLFTAICQMAARGDAVPLRAADRLPRLVGDGLVVWENPDLALQGRHPAVRGRLTASTNAPTIATTSAPKREAIDLRLRLIYDARLTVPTLCRRGWLKEELNYVWTRR